MVEKEGEEEVMVEGKKEVLEKEEEYLWRMRKEQRKESKKKESESREYGTGKKGICEGMYA